MLVLHNGLFSTLNWKGQRRISNNVEIKIYIDFCKNNNQISYITFLNNFPTKPFGLKYECVGEK